MNLNIITYNDSDNIHLLTFDSDGKPFIDGLVARYKRYTDDDGLHVGLATGKLALSKNVFSLYANVKTFRQNVLEALLPLERDLFTEICEGFASLQTKDVND